MPSIGTLGSTLSSGPKSLKVKHQALPHDGSIGLKQLLQPAHLSHLNITGLEPRVQLDEAGRSENFSVDTGAAYYVLVSYSRAYSSQTWTIWGATGTFSHQEASISHLNFSIREQTEVKPKSQKTTQSVHMEHSLV